MEPAATLTPPMARLEPPASSPLAAGAPKPASAKKGFSFWDFLDVINPLQHIPVVSTIYRAITGDTIRPEAKLVGGGLFGGPIGLALAAADTVVQQETGKDAGGHVMALLAGEKKPAAPVLAAAAPPTLSEGQLQLLAQSFNEIAPAAKPAAKTEAAHRREDAYEAALWRMADVLAAHRALDSAHRTPTVEIATLPPL